MQAPTPCHAQYGCYAVQGWRGICGGVRRSRAAQTEDIRPRAFIGMFPLMRRCCLIGLATLALALAGCGSSSHTPSQTSVSAADATTTATPTTPTKLSKKELAEQRAHERAQKAREAREKREREKEEEAARQIEAQETEEKAADNAKKLEEVWAEEPASSTDPEVLSIQRHLISLSHKCREDIPTLAGEVYSGVEIRSEEGVHESPAQIAADLDTAAPGKKVTSECHGVLAAMLVLLEQETG
jgi:hypothetical protein